MTNHDPTSVSDATEYWNVRVLAAALVYAGQPAPGSSHVIRLHVAVDHEGVLKMGKNETQSPVYADSLNAQCVAFLAFAARGSIVRIAVGSAYSESMFGQPIRRFVIPRD